MFDFAFICLFLLVIWGTGQGLLSLLRQPSRRLPAMPLGLAVTGLLANLMYFGLGLTMPLIQGLLAALGFLGLLQSLRRHPDWRELALVYGAFAFLSLPALIGDQQYYVFRGGVDDQLNYLESALAIYKHPWSFYQQASLKDLAYNHLLLSGAGWLNTRPAAAALFAGLFVPGWGDIHLKAFLYTTALWAMAYPVLIMLWRELASETGGGRDSWLNKASLPLYLVPAAILAGFYGQVIFDLNAWSHLASSSVLLAVTLAFWRLLKGAARPNHLKSNLSLYLITTLLAGGGFLFYPEGAVAHGLFYLGGTVIWLVTAKEKPKPAGLASLALIPVMALLISSLPHWEGTVNHLLKDQIYHSFRSTSLESGFLTASWWGIVKPESPFLSYLNIIPSWAGLFFLTPQYGQYGGPLIHFWAALTGLIGAALLLNLLSGLSLRFSKRQGFIIPLWGMIWALALGMIYYILAGSYWTAAKVITYGSPYLLLGLARPLLLSSPAQPKLWPKITNILIKGSAGLVVAGGLFFGLARPYSATDPDGLGYSSPNYPNPPREKYKKLYRWEISPADFDECRGVSVYASEFAQLRYLEHKLFYRNMPFTSEISVFAPYQSNIPANLFMPEIYADCQARDDWKGQKVGLTVEPFPSLKSRRFLHQLFLADPTLLMKNFNIKGFAVNIRHVEKMPQASLFGFGFWENSSRWTIGPLATIDLPQAIDPGEFYLFLIVAEVKEELLNKPLSVIIGDQWRTMPMSGPGVWVVPFETTQAPAHQIALAMPDVPTPKWIGYDLNLALGVNLVSLHIIPRNPGNGPPSPGPGTDF